jgi:hypothetical protein
MVNIKHRCFIYYYYYLFNIYKGMRLAVIYSLRVSLKSLTAWPWAISDFFFQPSIKAVM